MSDLKESLQKFHIDLADDLNKKKQIDKEFKKQFATLAEAFLYGGYISVSYNNVERYRIFIRTVEFYCHHEGDKKDLPKDPIVYHRNGRYVEGEVPYFPMMSIHAHASGYDITFENEDLELRSSALIRAYEVYDVKWKCFLFYDTKDKVFKMADTARVNKQSTYLYNFLNGFGGDNITWVDQPIAELHQALKSTPRQNVYKYDEHETKIADENGKYVKDNREWSFSRLDDVEIVKE